jgi:hypothetical protein
MQDWSPRVIHVNDLFLDNQGGAETFREKHFRVDVSQDTEVHLILMV